MHARWLLGLLWTLATPRIAPSQARAGAPDTTSRVVDRVFAALSNTDRPGCALGVGRNGRLIYEHGYGMANLETATPINPTSIFHVASVSKQFTATAIMLLARDGKLTVDDNIRKYVPEIPDYGTPITIRHLLTHTSGLRDQWSLLQLARGRFEENRITEADVLDIVPRQKMLNFTPGAEYAYSNTGFTLLAVIVKRVSGKSLREFADERIFRPLAMTSTHFHDDYTMLVPGRTSAYAPIAGGWRVSIPNFDTYGATSLFTTVGDLLKWEANFDSPVVGDRTIFEQMQTPGRLSNGDTLTYGFGLVMDRYRGVREVSHNGADAGYRSYVGRFPDQGLTIAIACNAATANTTVLAHGVADAYLGSVLAPVAAAPVLQTVLVPMQTLQRRAGAYLDPKTMQVVELSIRGDSLIVGRIAGPVLIPVAENRSRVTGQSVDFIFSDREHGGFQRQPLSGGRPVAFEWRPPAVATPSVLAAYAGDYYSEEVDARYRVIAGDSTISLRTGTASPMSARPVFLDTFLGGGSTIQFMRDGASVTGFEVSDVRMRRVRFRRIQSGR